MITDDFIDAIAPDDLYLALAPAAPLVGIGACKTYDPCRFPSPERQQAAFDGEAVDPATDYPAARAICYNCPLLAACRRYADESGDEHTFLAGLTAYERVNRRLKKLEMIRRRAQVTRLRQLGAPTIVIADLLGRDPSLIRRDIRALDTGTRSASA